MERRKAITTAAAASLTLLAGAAGIALNSGIVSGGGNDNVGQISPVNITNPPITVYIEDPATTSATAAPPVQPTSSLPVTTSAASGYEDDDRYEDEDNDDRSEHDNDDRDEYEGAEDDD
jgi:hypothetical protein